MGKLYSKWDLPPCPDPAIYIAVKYGDLWGWKRRRGTLKKTTLNAAFERNKNHMSVSSPAAKAIINKLNPLLVNLGNERRMARIGGLLTKGLNEQGVLDYSSLYGFEFQEAHPLKLMLQKGFRLELVNDHARFTIVLNENSVKPKNNLATQYFLELVLLQGELLNEYGLRVETDISALMDFHAAFTEEIMLPYCYRKRTRG